MNRFLKGFKDYVEKFCSFFQFLPSISSTKFTFFIFTHSETISITLVDSNSCLINSYDTWFYSFACTFCCLDVKSLHELGLVIFSFCSFGHIHFRKTKPICIRLYVGWAVGSQYMHGQMVMDILNVVHADSSNSSNTYSVTNFLNIVFHIFQIDSLEDFNIVFELVFWI